MRMNSIKVSQRTIAAVCPPAFGRRPLPAFAGRGLHLIGGLLVVVAVAISPASAHAADRPLPKLVHKDGRHALMVDGAPFVVLGAQVNNSSAWPGVLPQVWPAIKAIHANTVEMPVYWEQLEPKPGVFDYAVVDALITQARKNDVRVILLWFATWKNGGPHYMPLWMKQDPAKYPRMLAANGRAVGSASPFARETLEADKRAFVALMRHLKKFDAQRTVIMVQVENEPGTWGGLVRDHSPEAERLFAGPVPDALRARLQVKAPAGATWTEAFGKDADEFFHAWSVARYIGQVAAAGKEEYPLPLYVNAALRDPLTPGPAGTYETGGATDNVLDVWKAAAPAVDIQAELSKTADAEKMRSQQRAFEAQQLVTQAENARSQSRREACVKLIFRTIQTIRACFFLKNMWATWPAKSAKS